MERNALLAFVISIAILIGYQMLFEARAPSPQSADGLASAPVAADGSQEAQAVDSGGGSARGTQPGRAAGLEAPKPKLPAIAVAQTEVTPERPRLDVPEQTFTVETDLYAATLSSWGGRLVDFTLKKFRLTNDPESPLLNMVHSQGELPLGLQWPSKDSSKVLDDSHVAYTVEGGRHRLHAGETTQLVLRGRGPEGERITKTLHFLGDSYVLDFSVSVEGRSDPRLAVSWTREVAGKGSRFAGIDGPAALIDGKLKAKAAARLDPSEAERHQGDIAWAGYADHYFLAAFAPTGDLQHEFVALRQGKIGVATLWTAGAADTVDFKLFVGPKRLAVLRAAGHKLDGAIDLGWFSIVARPMLWLLLFIGRFTGNYGWAIIILTILIKVVMFPINQRQSNAMKAMQRIQPELKKIQEKYKDDRETLNKEMMELYKRHKVNPLSGCLPMVLQIPVFIGLYNGLLQSIELRHAPFLGWINDLSQPDRLGALQLPFVHPAGIPVLTLLMGLSMLIQQRMTPSTGDPTQQRMMMLMPVVFTVMFVNFPAGLVIYWFANNVLTIAQQYVTNRSDT